MKSKEIYDALSEKELITIIKKQNNTVLFGQLFDRYASEIYNKCLGFVGNATSTTEVTRMVFSKVFTTIHLFEYKTSFEKWLYMLTYNTCCDFLAAQEKTEMSRTSDKLNNSSKLNIEVSDSSLFQIHPKFLQKALEGLAPEQRALLQLVYQDNATIEELQHLYAMDKETIKTRLRIAKARVVAIYQSF